jgi:hypothetical protein
MVALSLTPITVRAAPRCRYQAQDTQQTLAEGWAEYYAQNRRRVLPPTSLAPESAELFQCHDLCHVIFGLDTTLSDEAMVDARTLFSCDVGWRRYAEYMTSDPEAKAIFKELGVFAALSITIRTVPRIGWAIWEARKMPKRWPWHPPEEYQHRSLSDLRREFGIRVI